MPPWQLEAILEHLVMQMVSKLNSLAGPDDHSKAAGCAVIVPVRVWYAVHKVWLGAGHMDIR